LTCTPTCALTAVIAVAAAVCSTEPGLRFIPVPAVTGFAGFWEVDAQRSTPHPQPIDIMNEASFIVKRVHKSIHAMVLGETEGQLTLAARPGFLPPGLPASYCEVYDKSNKTESTWTPRRSVAQAALVVHIRMLEAHSTQLAAAGLVLLVVAAGTSLQESSRAYCM
jgi:hypothetical protein